MSRWMFGGVLLLAILSASGVVPTLAHASDSGSAAATSAEAFAPLVLAQSSGPPSRGEGARAQRARRAHERAQQEARLAAERSRTRGRDYEFNALRSLVLVAGIGIFVWGLWLSRNGKKRLRKIQLALLFLVALASFASYYQFFTVVRHGGFRTPDNFHYYVGSKYFDSLGYYGLYDCSLAALTAQGARTIRPDQPVRDLRTMRTGTAAEALIRGRECEQRFTPERWRSFGKDVDWFSRLWPPHIWKAIWDDHGYHPTPVWNVIGGVIAEAVPTDDTDGIRMLTLADRYLVGLGLLAIGWAFGLEAACLATLVWGTGHLWRYTFVGDAYFRHFWWLSAVLGVCLLRRAWPSLAGASLGLSALLRLFPGALSLAFLVHATRASIRAGKLAPSGVRFIAGAALASGVFLGWALLAEAGGVSVFVAFAEKMRAFTQVPASNKVGLDVAMMWIFGVDEPASRASAWLLRLLFLYAFWRGLRNAEGWEAAAFGWTLIPILTDPTSYYYSFVMLGAVLAIRRPRIALILLFSCLAWNVNGLLNYREYVEYWYASIVAVLCTGAIAFEMGRAPSVAVAAVPEIEALPDPAGQG